MKRKITKGISVLLSLSVAGAFFLSNIRNNDESVAYAKEVFSQVEQIKNNATEQSPFVIAEIVDEKSNFEILAGTYKVGEEELAYMVGGSEPFRSMLTGLISASDSKSLQRTTEHTESDRSTFQDQFNMMITGLAEKGLVDKDTSILPGDLNASDYPLSRIYLQTKLPLSVAVGKENVDSNVLICLITKEDHVTTGYFVPSETGNYELVKDDATGKLTARFLGADGETHPLTFSLRNFLTMDAGSVSGNSVSDNSTKANENNSVSDNDTFADGSGVNESADDAGISTEDGSNADAGSGNEDGNTTGGDANGAGGENSTAVDTNGAESGNNTAVDTSGAESGNNSAVDTNGAESGNNTAVDTNGAESGNNTAVDTNGVGNDSGNTTGVDNSGAGDDTNVVTNPDVSGQTVRIGLQLIKNLGIERQTAKIPQLGAAFGNSTDAVSGNDVDVEESDNLDAPNNDATQEGMYSSRVAVGNNSARILYNYYEKLEDIPNGINLAGCIPVGNSALNTTAILDGSNSGGAVDGNISVVADTAATNTANIVESATIYNMTYLGIQNNEWLKENVFGVDITDADAVSSINIKVEVFTPSELNTANGIDALNGKNLIYLNMDLQAGSINNTGGVDVPSTGGGTIATTSIKDINATVASALTTDINETVASALKSKIMADVGPVPCIINSNAYHALDKLYGENNNHDGSQNNGQSNSQNNIRSYIYDVMQEAYNMGPADDLNSFVVQNIFFVDGLLSEIDNVGTDTDATATGGKGVSKKITLQLAEYKSDTSGFEEVFYRIEQENYEREQTGKDEVEKIITPSTAIQTILVYTPIDTQIKKAAIRVLELQPCYDFSFASQRGDSDDRKQEKLNNFKSKFLPQDSQVSVEVVGMTTSEFCGKIEDINAKYDMIYFGSNTGTMILNQVSNNQRGDCTVYNDTDMFGIVYSHTGDKYTLNATEFYGLVKNDAQTKEFRFSGNDIRADQKKILLDFLESGAPVVLASDFLLYDDNGTSKGISTELLKDSQGNNVQVTHNGTKYNRYGILDNSTYIYQFIKDASANKTGSSDWNWENRKYTNLLVEKKNGVNSVNISNELSTWLNQPKLSIELLSQPAEYSYTTKAVVNGQAQAIDSITYLTPDANGEYYLSYDFSIKDLANTQVTSARYSVSLLIDFNADGKYSEKSEKAKGIEVITLGDNSPVKEDELILGVTYRVNYRLPDGLAGAIPWKLEIKDVNRGSIRDVVEGLTTVRSERQRVKVLQIYENKGTINNLEEIIKQDPNGLWASLLNSVPEFEFEIVSIAADHYLGNHWKLPYYADGRSNSDQLNKMGDINSYDMIIIGFADSFQHTFNSSTTAMDRVKALLDFADSGKCILFSHDNTNWKNATTQDYTFNMAIRDIAGLDRYGASIYRASETDRALYESNNKIKNGEEIQANSLEELRNILFGSDGLKGYSRDIAFKVNSNQTAMYKNTQGFTYASVIGPKKISGYPNLHYPGIGAETWINQDNHQIRKINTGIITEYPFRLEETINVNSSHAQYYQLDFESDRDGDGEGDIVVWYTMDNSVAGNNNDLYDRSPGDVRNNYYIYSKGNVTYSGMGHSAITTNQDEIKITINTMVAAYRASMKAPSVSFVESTQDTTRKSFIAVPYDEAMAQDPVYRAYFQVIDSSFLGDDVKQIRARIYTAADQVGTGTVSITLGPDNTVQVEDRTTNPDWKLGHPETGDLQRKTDTDGKEYYELQSGVVYYVDIPLTGNLSETKGIDLYMEAETTIANKNFVSAKVYDRITINQMKLVDLD